MCSTAIAPTFHTLPTTPAYPVHRQSYPISLPSITHSRLPSRQQVANEAALQESRLRTPTRETMSAAYQPPQLSAYDNHALLPYSSGLGHGSRSKASAMSTETTRVAAQYSRYATNSGQPQYQARNTPTITSQPGSASRQATHPSTPTGKNTIRHHEEGKAPRRDSSTLVLHSLQIPSCISAKGGNLADFAAQVRVSGSQVHAIRNYFDFFLWCC
jgi:hypothetical protein